MGKLMYPLQLDPPGAPDVVSREMVLTTPTGTVTKSFPAALRDLSIVVNEDSTNTLSMVDIDERGNRSAPAVLTWEALDTIPPPAPGMRFMQPPAEVADDATGDLVAPDDSPAPPSTPEVPATPPEEPATPPAPPEEPATPPATPETPPEEPATPPAEPETPPAPPEGGDASGGTSEQQS